MPVWDGIGKSPGDYEFKLHQFVEPFKFFEKWLDRVWKLPRQMVCFGWGARAG